MNTSNEQSLSNCVMKSTLKEMKSKSKTRTINDRSYDRPPQSSETGLSCTASDRHSVVKPVIPKPKTAEQLKREKLKKQLQEIEKIQNIAKEYQLLKDIKYKGD